MKMFIAFLCAIALLAPMGPAAADLNDGLVGHWPFDGNANDATGNGHDGAVNNATLTTDRHGVANSAYEFIDYASISVPHHPQLNVVGNATFAAWVQKLKAPPGFWDYGYDPILQKGSQYKTYGLYLSCYYCDDYNDSYIFLNAGDNLSSYDLGNWQQWYQEWHHVAGVVASDSGMMSMYVDGVLIGSVSTYYPWVENNNTEPLNFGAGGLGWNYLNGKLDDIRIYDRALAECEIAELAGTGGCITNTAPDITGAAPSIASLWPPNNKMVDISIEGVTDADGDEIAISIDSISDDEGSDPDDAVANGDTASLRAQRDGSGDGRTYTIEFTADDGNGGVSTGSVTVEVPHDQGSGKKKGRGKIATGTESTSWGAIKKSLD